MDERTREQRIRTAMDREAAHVVPRANLWPTIQRQLRQKQAAAAKAAGLRPRPPQRRFAPRPHLSLASANLIFASLLVISLAVLVVLPPARAPQSNSPATIMRDNPGAVATFGPDQLPPALDTYAQPLELSQTVDSYTVTLERVYFDASIVMVSYAISGPRTRYLSAMGNLSYTFDRPVRAAESSSHSPRNSYYTNPSFNGVQSNVAPNASWNNNYTIVPSQGWQVNNQVADGMPVYGVASFDSPAAITDSLTLHLDLALTINPQIELYSVSPQLTPNLAQDVAAPFVFDFTAPHVAAQKVISVARQFAVGDANIILEKVMLTPASTSFMLRYEGAAFNQNMAWQPDLTITPAGQQIGPDTAIEVRKEEDGTWIYASHVTLFDRPGLYTVTISALHGYDQTNPSASETQLNGPWTFQFTVPP